MLRNNLLLMWRAVFLLITALLAFSSPPLTRAQTPCGAWQLILDPQDSRVTGALINPGSGSNCLGAVRLSNGTGVPLFGGGYAIELDAFSIQNSGIQWQPLYLAHGNQGSQVDLMPSLDIELHAIPNAGAASARVNVRGEMTVRSFAEDAAVFMIRSALELTGSSCVVPKQQVIFAAARVASIVSTTADLAANGDSVGARQEFSQVADEFFARAGESFKEIGVNCAFDLMEHLVGEHVFIAKVGVALATWIPVAIFDYFKYQGRPVNFRFEYAPALPVVAGGVAVPPPAPLAPVGPPAASPLVYQGIVSKISGLCLDVQNESQANGSHVWQVGCNGKDNQLWNLKQTGNYYEIIAKHSGKCMSAEGGSSEDGINMVQLDCNGAPGQLWELVQQSFGYSLIKGQPSGRCLDVAMRDKSPGAYIIQWDCSGDDNQLWLRR